MVEKEKLRNAGVEGDSQGRVFLKLSGALMCLRPAESKETESVSAVPGGLQRHMQQQQTEDGEMEGEADVKTKRGRDVDVKIKTNRDTRRD